MGCIGLMLEDHAAEIGRCWRQAVAVRLPQLEDPALAPAIPIFLRELARGLAPEGLDGGSPGRGLDPWRRCGVLLRLLPREGATGLVLELTLLREALWEVLRRHHRLVTGQERSVVDGAIDAALVATVQRLEERALLSAAVRAAPAPRPAVGAPSAAGPRGSLLAGTRAAAGKVQAGADADAIPPPAPRVPARSAGEARLLAEQHAASAASGRGRRPPPLPTRLARYRTGPE